MNRLLLILISHYCIWNSETTMKCLTFGTLFGILAIVNAMKSYENYKVYKVVPISEQQVQQLVDLHKDGYDFWTEVFDVGSDVRILVSPAKDQEFSQYTRTVGLNATVAIANVQK